MINWHWILPYNTITTTQLLNHVCCSLVWLFAASGAATHHGNPHCTNLSGTPRRVTKSIMQAITITTREESTEYGEHREGDSGSQAVIIVN